MYVGANTLEKSSAHSSLSDVKEVREYQRCQMLFPVGVSLEQLQWTSTTQDRVKLKGPPVRHGEVSIHRRTPVGSLHDGNSMSQWTFC